MKSPPLCGGISFSKSGLASFIMDLIFPSLFSPSPGFPEPAASHFFDDAPSVSGLRGYRRGGICAFPVLPSLFSPCVRAKSLFFNVMLLILRLCPAFYLFLFETFFHTKHLQLHPFYSFFRKNCSIHCNKIL